MENKQSSNLIIDKIIEFVRGDMLTSDFEQWVYSNSVVEKALGKDLFLEVVSTDFSSTRLYN